MAKSLEPTVLPGPPPGRERVDWAEVAKVARENPGQWVQVPKILNPTVATYIKRGKYPHVPPDEFEVTTRRTPEGAHRCNIFVRTR